jgi:hypothetical protein
MFSSVRSRSRPRRVYTPIPYPVEFTAAEIAISRRLFLFGFCFLPFLWLVNWIKFRQILKPLIPLSPADADADAEADSSVDSPSLSPAAAAALSLASDPSVSASSAPSVPPSLYDSVRYSRALFLLCLVFWSVWLIAFYALAGTTWANAITIVQPNQ